VCGAEIDADARVRATRTKLEIVLCLMIHMLENEMESGVGASQLASVSEKRLFSSSSNRPSNRHVTFHTVNPQLLLQI